MRDYKKEDGIQYQTKKQRVERDREKFEEGYYAGWEDAFTATKALLAEYIEKRNK